MKKVNLFTILLILIAAIILSYILLKIMLWLGFLVLILGVITIYILIKKKERTGPEEP